MANFNQTDDAALLGTIIATEAVEKLKANLVLAKLVTRQFEREIPQNKTVSVPKYGAPTIGEKTAGSPASYSNMTITTEDISLEKHFIWQTVVEDTLSVTTRQRVVENVSSQVSLYMAEAIENYIATTIVGGVGGTIGTYGTAVTPSGIAILAQNFNTEKAPITYPRNLIISPKGQHDLYEDNVYRQSYSIGGTEVIRDGRLVPLFGVNLYMSQIVPLSGANYRGVSFIEPAVALVTAPLPMDTTPSVSSSTYIDPDTGLSIRVQMWYDPDYKGKAMSFEILCGCAILRSEWVYEYKH